MLKQISENEQCTKVLLGTGMHTFRGETTRPLVSVFSVTFLTDLAFIREHLLNQLVDNLTVSAVRNQS